MTTAGPDAMTTDFLTDAVLTAAFGGTSRIQPAPGTGFGSWGCTDPSCGCTSPAASKTPDPPFIPRSTS